MDKIKLQKQIEAEFNKEGIKSYDLFFNKINGTYLGLVTSGSSKKDEPDTVHKWKTISLDLSKECWVGDYDSGSVKLLTDTKPLITELDINKSCGSKIINKYDTYHQLNILAKALIEMGSTNLELLEMVAFIDEAKKVNKANQEAYKHSINYDYKSKEDIMSEMDIMLQGGLREVVGPWRLK